MNFIPRCVNRCSSSGILGSVRGVGEEFLIVLASGKHENSIFLFL